MLYVDRTRYTTGLSHCMMNRYLGHHLYGTGITYTGSSIPLVTGSHTHTAIEEIVLFCKEVQESSPNIVSTSILEAIVNENIVRNAIEASISTYTLEVDETEIRKYTEVPEDIDTQVTEQCSLVGGLVWTWVKKGLPWVLENYTIIAVEQEYEYVIGCNCGLSGIGEVAIHEERGCSGVVLMTRPDLILRDNKTRNLVYVELKTGSDVKNRNYSMQFEDNVQFALGALAASRILGEEIRELYVHALHKGKRDSEYNVATKEYSGPKKQNSPFCYTYYKEGNPPLVLEELLPSYWNKDPGSTKRWGATEKRGYNKLPVWDIKFQDKPEEMPYYEYVVNRYQTLDSGDGLDDNIRFIGPIDNPAFLTDRLVVELEYEERRWADRIEYLDESLAAVNGEIGNPEFQEALGMVIPRSWDCYKYAGWCDKISICYQRAGWEDPLSLDKYIQRTPNHPIELNSTAFKELNDEEEEEV